MKDTSFLAFFNTAGIACASSQDKTIYSLSKEEPIALAVNPGSMIPWETIINKYRSMGEPAHRDTVEAYALDFEAFLKNQPVEAKWNNLSTQDANIIFMENIKMLAKNSKNAYNLSKIMQIILEQIIKQQF